LGVEELTVHPLWAICRSILARFDYTEQISPVR